MGNEVRKTAEEEAGGKELSLKLYIWVLECSQSEFTIMPSHFRGGIRYRPVATCMFFFLMVHKDHSSCLSAVCRDTVEIVHII